LASNIDDTATHTSSEESSKKSSGSNAPVLVIDDDETTLGLMKELLELHDHLTLTAKEGNQGIEIFAQERPHLVITDIRMPGMDGMEVLRKIREIDEQVPVVLVTGFGDLDLAIGALRVGAYDFLQKPINPDLLLKTVKHGLEHYRLRRFESDYTELLRSQVEERTRELAESNDFLEGILNSTASVSIITTDFDQHVMSWNTGAERIFGYTADEMVGSKISKLYVQDDSNLEVVTQLREKLWKKGEPVHALVKQLAKDGKILNIALALSPMKSPSGELRGILGLGRDVTEEFRLNVQLKKVQSTAVFALAKLAEWRDGETGYHLRRLRAYCEILCRQLRTKPKYESVITDQFIENLVQSSVLHDIGKVALDDEILFNSDRFQEEEYERMKLHTIYGGQALEEAAEEAGEETFLSVGKDVAYYHHEHWDGSGYPFGIEGEEIPLAARIVSIADVYDAITTERRYKRSYSHEDTCAIIVKNRGKQFDPTLVDVFLEVQEEFKAIRIALSKEDQPTTRVARNAGQNIQTGHSNQPTDS
jgi:PAS domain S-box-containing protein